MVTGSLRERLKFNINIRVLVVGSYMSQSNVAPTLEAGLIASLTTEQVVAWYSRHWNPSVRALCTYINALEISNRKACGDSYEQGFRDAIDGVLDTIPPPKAQHFLKALAT